MKTFWKIILSILLVVFLIGPAIFFGLAGLVQLFGWFATLASLDTSTIILFVGGVGLLVLMLIGALVAQVCQTPCEPHGETLCQKCVSDSTP